jgi:hypothetical protein
MRSSRSRLREWRSSADLIADRSVSSSNGFSMKSTAPGLHRLHGHGHVAMTGHHDHGKAGFQLGEPALQFQPIHLRHADVGDHATRLGVRQDLQERHRRIVNAHGEAPPY